MKKLLSLALVAILMFTFMAGCKKEPTASTGEDYEEYTSDLGVVIVGDDSEETSDSQGGSNGNGTGNNGKPSSTPITNAANSNKKGFYLNDLNNTGKKATVKNNTYSTGYPIAQKTITFDVMIKDYTSGDDYDLMKINDFFKEKMNVKINWMPVSQLEMANKMVLAFSSGNMPDMFWGCEPFGTTNIYKYAKQGLVVELDKYIDTYAPNIKRMFKEEPATKYAVTYENDKIYSVPMLNGERDPFVYEGLYINNAWLKRLNLSMPTNTSNFMKVLNAFKNNDPNGNGKADEIPLCLVASNMTGILPGCLYGPFGLPVYGGYAGYSINDNGKVVANYITDNYKTALTYYKTLYKRGLIDAEWTSNGEDQLKKKIAAGSVGAFVAEHAYNLMDSKTLSNYVLVPAFRDKSASRPTWAVTNVENIWSGWGIVTSSCKNPEAAVRVMDYFYSLEGTLTAFHGPQGINWDVKKDGTIYMTDAYYKGTSNKDLTPGYAIPNYQSSKYYSLIDKTKSSKTPEKDLKIAQYQKELRTTYLKAAPKNVMPNLIRYEKDKVKGKETSEQLGTYIQQLTGEFITGKTDISAFWDNYVSVCKSLGCDNEVYYLQVAYDRYKKHVK